MTYFQLTTRSSSLMPLTAEVGRVWLDVRGVYPVGKVTPFIKEALQSCHICLTSPHTSCRGFSVTIDHNRALIPCSGPPVCRPMTHNLAVTAYRVSAAVISSDGDNQRFMALISRSHTKDQMKML